MTQLDDLQAYTNFEIPRRTAFLTVAIAGYDGDPNDGAASSILKNAPVGTWYLRETPLVQYRKHVAGSTGWVEEGFSASRQLYADPTGGSDSNDGSSGSPFQTLHKASQRTWEGENQRLNLLAGTHRKHDWGGGFFGTNVLSFGSMSTNLVIGGATTSVGAFDVLSTSGLDVTVDPDPGWTIDEHKGRIIDLFPPFEFDRVIMSNTSDTFRLAYQTTELGGGLTPLSGTIEILNLDTVIEDPLTEPGWAANSMFLFGNVQLRRVKFLGPNTGVLSYTPSTNLSMSGVVFENNSQGMFFSGAASISGVAFINCSTGFSGGGLSSVAFQDIAIIDTGVGITSRGSFSFSTNSMIAAVGTGYVMEASAGGNVRDGTGFVHLDGVSNHGAVGRGSTYNKISNPLVGQPGFLTLAGHLFRMDGVGNSVNLYDVDAMTIVPTSELVSINGASVSLATYLAAGNSLQAPGGNFVEN